jgi:glycine/D-amino acid oxidase-like deaminating enzyme/nitrite reductase/ring-hydroxylating ferredoxin subunit
MRTLDARSYWIDSAPLPSFRALERDLEVDVVIVGAGITGITAAFLLKRAGKRVALVERARCASIDTGHTTAHVTAVTDLRLTELVKTFGAEGAKAVWDAGAAAIDRIVANIRTEGIDCDFRWVPGYLHAPIGSEGGADADMFREEAATAASLGIAASYTAAVPHIGVPGVKFPHQALFHPRKYVGELLRKIPGNGSHVFEETEIVAVEDEPLAVATARHKIRCSYVVMATHNPHTGKAGAWSTMLFQTKLALYTTYAVGGRIPSESIPQAAFWDTSDPYYYLRVDRRPDGDYAIFGGEDHKTGQDDDTDAAFQRLEARFLQIAPQVVIDHRWSGQVIETNDGLPFIGENAERQFAATGFAGNGMTFGTLSAMMALDAAMHRPNPWRDLFAVNRKKIRGGMWDFIRENKDYPYYMVRDRLAPTEGSSLSEVARGEGKIIGWEGKKVAAYRDYEGKLTLCSPICTHLKCIVGWNDAEHTWDCPCHGSRFRPNGEVISGPAEEPLERLPTPADQ